MQPAKRCIHYLEAKMTNTLVTARLTHSSPAVNSILTRKGTIIFYYRLHIKVNGQSVNKHLDIPRLSLGLKRFYGTHGKYYCQGSH